jgi:hypothetical protein
MELLDDMGHGESCFGLFRDGVSIGVRQVHGLRGTFHRLKWKLVLVRLEIVLILTQDGCIVYAERAIGSKIILDAPDGTPR